VETGVTVDAAMIRSLGPDVVVVATGARPRRPQLELVGEPTILDAWQILLGAEVPDGRVVVADWRCDWIGLGLAELLARRGRRVTLASTGYMAGQRIQQYVRDTMMAGAIRAGAELVPLVRLFGYDGRAVFLQQVLTGEAVIVEDVTALVLAQGHVAEDALLRELQQDWAGEVHGVGDCLAPRTVEEAVLEGLRVGSSL
jgi:pyruvate/2-oxoglutarate dehydrogenase complex dihydrolipoamide dehydrogenase (E3) component